MISLVPIIAGIAALAVGVLVLRTYGPRFRVGRLLASTPKVSVAQAREFAKGRPRYVRVDGRIDAEDAFEDDAHRALVFRRTRLQLRRDATWVALEDGRERVRFEVREGLAAIAVDDAALDVGLVVMPRESVGSAADVGDRVPAGTPAETPVRLLIEQLSSVEHAIVLGVPSLGADGEPILSVGLGRPLVLTTFEPDEAMRVLTEGDRRRPLVAVACFAGGFVLIGIGLVLAATGVALGASPSPNAGAGDPRSSGQGPGLVGDPLFAVVGVVAVGLAALLLTLAYVRITGRRGT